MKFRTLILGALGFCALCSCGMREPAGPPWPDSVEIDPDQISDFSLLYRQNCAGCHGVDGKGGAAISLADPVYLAIADDSVLRHAASNGIAGTSMPAFAKSEGGMLTSKQIDIIVQGIRERWAKPDILRGANPPPYSSTTSGNSARGAEVFATYCSSCHGPAGKGGQKGSSIVDGSFLALVSDQGSAPS